MTQFTSLSGLAGLAAAGGIAVIGVLTLSGGSAAPDTQVSEPENRGVTGDFVPCPGGGEVQTWFAQQDDTFALLGTLKDIGPNAIVVNSALGATELSLNEQPAVEGEYALSDPLRAAGRVTDAGLEVLTVQPVCAAPVAVTEVTPAPTPFVEVELVEATAVPAPVLEGSSDDDGRDGDDDGGDDDPKPDRGRDDDDGDD